MSRTILAKADGFTPVIDTVMKNTSLTAAVVFGGMWRYCQMKNGVCQASLDKIAERVGLSRQAVIEHVKMLEKTGYIKDMTPNLRNRPHTYRDTGKAGLHIGVTGVNDVYSENHPGVSDVDSDSKPGDGAVNVVDSHSTPNVLEDSIKKGVKKEKENCSKKQKLLVDLQHAAVSVFGNNLPAWRRFERELEQECVMINREDGRLVISGVGLKAAMYQDRYARAFANVLVGIYNQPVEVVFED